MAINPQLEQEKQHDPNYYYDLVSRAAPIADSRIEVYQEHNRHLDNLERRAERAAREAADAAMAPALRALRTTPVASAATSISTEQDSQGWTEATRDRNNGQKGRRT